MDDKPSSMPPELLRDLKEITGVAAADQSGAESDYEGQAVLGTSMPERGDHVPEDDPEGSGNPLLSALGGDFPRLMAEDPRLAKIAQHNMSRIVGNMTVAVTEFEAKLYTLSDPDSIKEYSKDMLANLADKTIVVTEEPIQYLTNPVTGGLTVVLIVKTLKMVPTVKGIDRAPLTDVSSAKT